MMRHGRHGASRLGLLLLLTTTGCGRAESQVARHDAWPGSWATGSLMVGGLPLCSATLVAPDVVVTSGRCVRAALGGDSTFRWRRGMAQFDTPVRAGRVLDGNGALQPGGRWLQATASQKQRAVMRGIQQHCGIKDMFALSRSAMTRRCLDTIAPTLLREAGGLGLAAWHDIGWLGLQDPVPTMPATPAWGGAPSLLQDDADLRRIGVYRTSGLRASPLQRYEHPYALYEADDHEVHAAPYSGRAHDDIGSGLWARSCASGQPQWLLVGVGSRPYVAHSDTSAGLIFSRLDRHAAAMQQALHLLTRYPAF